MIHLIKIHWIFFRKPTEAIELYVHQWPLGLGLSLYIFFVIGNHTMDFQQLSIQLDLFAHYSGSSNINGLYGWFIFTTLITILFYWYVTPLSLRLITKKPREEFDANLYRKILFYSPAAFVIFSIVFLLPVKIALLAFIKAGMQEKNQVAIFLILAFFQGLLSLWAAVLAVSSLVLIWKGLRKCFSLTTWQIIIVQFIIPSIVFVPMFLLRFPKIWKFVFDYATAR